VEYGNPCPVTLVANDRGYWAQGRDRSLPFRSVGGKWSSRTSYQEFKKYAPILTNPSNPWFGDTFRGLGDEDKKSAPYFSLAWAIGNALSIVDVKGFEKQVIEVCKNSRYGAARQMIVLGLGRFSERDAEDAAIDLLNDSQVQIHAIGALAKMKSQMCFN
jgi:hypothetical protein